MSDEKAFYNSLRLNPRPLVVDFWAPWCGPCRSIEPSLKRLGQEYDGRVDVWKINADEQPGLLRQLGVYGIPTLIVYRSGQEVTRQTGAGGPERLRALFESGLSGEKPAASSLTVRERLLRLVLGGALLALAYSGAFAGFYLVLAGLGGLVMFSAVHDRCPVWQALAPRLKALIRQIYSRT